MSNLNDLTALALPSGSRLEADETENRLSLSLESQALINLRLTRDTDRDSAEFAILVSHFVTGQGLLVAADSDIASVDDLDSSTTVCSATGSTPIQNIKENYPEVKTKEYDTYSKCVEDLKNGQVDAVTTDEAILIGYAAQDPDNLKVVGLVGSLAEPLSARDFARRVQEVVRAPGCAGAGHTIGI